MNSIKNLALAKFSIIIPLKYAQIDMTNNFYCLKTESKSYILMKKHNQGSIFVSTESKLALTNLFLYSTVRLMRNWNTGKINTWYRLVNHAGLALGMILLLIQYAYKRCSKLKHKVIAKYTFFILFDTQLYPWYGYQNKNMVLIAPPKTSILAQKLANIPASWYWKSIGKDWLGWIEVKQAYWKSWR